MRSIVVLILFIAAVSAVPDDTQRIAGGSYTTIDNYPSMGAFSYTNDLINYIHQCGGAILNNRAILTAAHCLMADDNIRRMRVRLGSSNISSGGVIYQLSRIIMHPNWGTGVLDSDIAIVNTDRLFEYTNVIQPGSFAGANYNVNDDSSVWAAGWGSTGGAPRSEQLKHVQLWTVNHDTCRNIFPIITDRVICVLPRAEGNGQCSGDSGSPLYHGNVIIGVLSFGGGVCGSTTLPTVSASVSSYISWILSNV